jgi:hypothetical protein
MTREPFALVHQSRVFLGDRSLEAASLAVEHQILEGPMRGMEDDRRRRFVDLARLDAHVAIFDHVDPADPMKPADPI